MTVAFTRTREQIGDLVLGKLGVKDSQNSASAADLALVYEAMDLRLKEMHRLGMFWRNVSEVTVPITTTGGTATAAGPSDVLYPIGLWYQGSNFQDHITIVNPSTYADIENKTEAGLPEVALWKADGTFVFWPVSSSAITVNLLYQKVADDTLASTAPDVEVSMIRWLKDILAYDLGDQFSVPEQKMVRFERESKEAEKNIRALQPQQRVELLPVVVDGEYFFHSRFKRDWNTG
jgi:hypothetical protein